MNRTAKVLRPARLAIAVAAFCLAAPATVSGQPRTEAEARQFPQSLAEVAPAPIPDDQNAAAQIEALNDLISRWSHDYTAFSNSPLGLAYDQREDRGEPPTAEEAAEIRKILDRYADLDAGLQRAAACDKFASRGDFTKPSSQFIDSLLERIQRFRNVQRFLAWEMVMARFDGKHEDDVRRGVDMLRLSRLHQHEPTMVAFLVSCAVENLACHELYDALAAGPVSFDVHTTLDAELETIDDPGVFSRVMRSERAFTLTAEKEQVGPAGGLGALIGLGAGKGGGDYLKAVIDASDASWDDFRKEAHDGGKWGKPTGYGTMADLLSPAVVAATEAHTRTLAVVRCLRIYNALRLFEKTERREAKGVEDLDLPAEAMADPYTGKPLIAKHTKDGWLIYSVMSDGKDDGGDFKDLHDYGLSPTGDRRAQ